MLYHRNQVRFDFIETDYQYKPKYKELVEKLRMKNHLQSEILKYFPKLNP
jgi:hypothetical protein